MHSWCHEDAPPENSDRDMETVEAEVVFLAMTKDAAITIVSQTKCRVTGSFRFLSP